MNIAADFSNTSKLYPNKKAIILPIREGSNYTYQTISFHELEQLSNRYANGLVKNGIVKGTKVLLFVRPSLRFHAIVIAVMKVGAVAVFIDPAMGRPNLLNALEEAQPEALIAEPRALLLKVFYRSRVKYIKKIITVGDIAWPSTIKLTSFENESDRFEASDLTLHETCAILFTSGGTGKPKGVIYSHGIFDAQIKILKQLFSLTDKDVDLSGFPMFSLFTLVMGMTSCIPDMDPSHPADAQPSKLYKNIIDNGVTFISGSPAIWKPFADYCFKNNYQLDKVHSVVMFGAPVRAEIHEQFKNVLVKGDTYTPYGATEALPVTCTSGSEILGAKAKKNAEGKGTCVGKKVGLADMSIIKITEEPIVKLNDSILCPFGEVGEIIVKGEIATRAYFKNDRANRLSKIKDGSGFWHRMGDLGYIDEEGFLWFCGRKDHKVMTEKGLRFSIPCEGVFNVHKDVARTALVGIGNGPHQSPELVIELNQKINRVDRKKIEDELRQLGSRFEHTRDIQRFHYIDSFPVDVRHNIKIDRLALKKLVENKRL